MVQQLLKAFEILSSVSKAKSTVVIRNDGMHNEARWRKEFPLFTNGFYKVKSKN